MRAADILVRPPVGARGVFMDIRPIPQNFPHAWLEAVDTCRRPPTVVTLDSLAFLGDVFSKLSATSPACTVAIARAAIDERVRSCHKPRVSSEPLQRLFLIPEVSQLRDARSIDPRAVPIIDFAMAIRNASIDAVDQLGNVACGLLASTGGIAECVYRSLATIPKLIDTMRAGVAIREIAAILAAVAAAHDLRVHGSAERSRVVLNRVAWRIRAAGEALRAATAQRSTWAVLYDSHACFEDPVEIPCTPLCIGAAIALGERTPIPVFRTTTEDSAESQFVNALKEILNNVVHQWTINDALIPCGFIPIRTKHYVAYMHAVGVIAAALADQFGGPFGDDAIDRRCAWGLVALASVGDFSGFSDWGQMRAHQVPLHGRTHWLAARALLSQPMINAERLERCIIETVAVKESEIHKHIHGRLALICMATRTPNGIFVLGRPSIAACVLTTEDGFCALDCMADSPSGALELDSFETGWSEFDSEHDSPADAVGRELTRSLMDIVESPTPSEQSDWILKSILRFSLVPENLLTAPWKSALKTICVDLERALVAYLGGGFGVGREESTKQAVRFRLNCLRALGTSRFSSEHDTLAAIATFLSDDNGNTCAFARTFLETPDSVALVVEYEFQLRRSISNLRPVQFIGRTTLLPTHVVTSLDCRTQTILEKHNIRAHIPTRCSGVCVCSV